MVRLTWLGDPGCEVMTWLGVTFKKDVPVAVDNAQLIALARDNQYFTIDEANHVEAKSEEDQAPEPQVKEDAPRKDPQDYPTAKKKARKPKAKEQHRAEGLPARTPTDT